MKAVIRTIHEAQNFLTRWQNKFNDKPMTIELKPFKQPRTLPQNAKAHAMIGEIADHVGHTPTEIKQYLKDEFAPRKTLEIGGRIIDVPIGTSEMTAEQMSAFVEHIYQVGNMAGVTFSEDA